MHRSTRERSHTKRWFSTLFENCPVGVMMIDTAGRIMSVNAADCRFFGCAAGDLIGKCFCELPRPEGPDPEDGLLAALLRGEQKSYTVEKRYLRKGGDVVWGRVHASLVDEGGPPQVLVLHGDVTEDKQTEEALRAWQRAVAASPAGIVVIDGEGRLAHANPAALEMWGITELAEVLGRDAPSLCADPAEGAHLIEQLRVLGRVTEELVAKRKDGSIFDALVGATAAMGERGGVEFMIATVFDISRQKQAEKSLMRAEASRKEAEGFAAAGRMAARVAHEINNPLAGITNCFRLVKQAVPKGHPYQKYVALIDNEVERIGRIVCQMYELQGPGRGESVRMNVRETIGNVVAMLEHTSRQHEVEVRSAVAPDCPDLWLPKGALQQVLYNLLANAIEASPPGEFVQIEAAATSSTCRITVSDRGEGVPQNARTNIFEPFFTTKGSGSGANFGLGLSVCKEIVDSAGGSIKLVPGSGPRTTFAVVLPAARPEEANHEESTP